MYKPRDVLMSRANSLKKAVRQIIEHTERGEYALKLHGPVIAKYFKGKAITSIWSYISNLDIGAQLLIGAAYKE